MTSSNGVGPFEPLGSGSVAVPASGAGAGEGLERRAVLPPVVDDAAKALPVALDLNRTHSTSSQPARKPTKPPHSWKARKGLLLPSRMSCQLRQPLHPYSMKVAKGCLVSLPPLMYAGQEQLYLQPPTRVSAK